MKNKNNVAIFYEHENKTFVIDLNNKKQMFLSVDNITKKEKENLTIILQFFGVCVDNRKEY